MANSRLEQASYLDIVTVKPEELSPNHKNSEISYMPSERPTFNEADANLYEAECLVVALADLAKNEVQHRESFQRLAEGCGQIYEERDCVIAASTERASDNKAGILWKTLSSIINKDIAQVPADDFGHWVIEQTAIFNSPKD